ncbi:MAG: ABC transporter permease [Blautia sp.]|jgi:putative ABC transport system permease protein
MNQVKNKEVLRRLSTRTLAAKKSKNLIAVFAIILTTVLFTTLFVVGGSAIESSQNETMRKVGTSAHAGLKNVMPEDYEKVARDAEVKDVSYNIFVGFLRNPKLNKYQSEVRYFEEKDAKWGFCYPTTGTLPQKMDEVALSTLLLDGLGVPHELGAQVPLILQVQGRTIEKTFRLSGYWQGDMVMGAQSVAVSREFCDSVIDEPTQSFDEAKATEPDGYWNVNIYFKNSWNLEKQGEELLARCGFNPETTHLGINWAYGFSSVDTESILLVAGLLLLITLSGYLIIYNVFYINIYSDIRFYGLLKTIGTTGRQLKGLVRRQALLLCLIGIPVGLLIGYGVGYVLTPIAFSSSTFSYTGFEVSSKPWVFVGAALFSLFTVLLSCRKPCQIAAKVSPVEAVRYTEQAKQKKRQKKTKKVSPLSMAMANLGRNKRKLAVTVLSLSLSLILLTCVYTLVKGFDMDKFLKAQIEGDLSVTGVGVERPGNSSQSRNQEKAVTQEYRDGLRAQEGVTKISNVYTALLWRPNLSDEEWAVVEEIMEQSKLLQDSIYQDALEEYRKNKGISARLYGVDENLWDQIPLEEGVMDKEKLASGEGIIVNRVSGEELLSGKDGIDYYHVGDKVTLDVGPDPENAKTREYEVIAVASLPWAMGTKSGLLINQEFILSSGEFLDSYGDDWQPLRVMAEVEKEKQEAVAQWSEDYCETVDTELISMSRAAYEKEFTKIIDTFSIIGGLLSFILGLIGILNFINATVTSILSRHQELAMMEAVGMTGGQQKRMLMWEGCGYAISTLLVCLTIGMSISYAFIQMFTGQMDYFTYHPTILPLVICLPVLLGLSVLVPVLAYQNFCKTSVVDRIRIME